MALRLLFSVDLVGLSIYDNHVQVGQKQDHHFSVSASWLPRSKALARELVELQLNKLELEQAIGRLQAEVASATLAENLGFKMA